MAIYDNNGSTSTEIGKLYDNNGSTSSQIHVVYDNNGTTSYEIYRDTETLFSGVSLDTGIASGQNVTKTAYSSEYTNNGYASLAVTGTVGAQVAEQGTYGYGAHVYIQGYNGSWVNLKSYNVGGNASVSTSAAATVNISGYSKIRVFATITTANIGDGQATSGKAYTTNLKGIAT